MKDWSTRPLTRESWPDFERLFGSAGGVFGGCWCTYWRLPGPEWQAGLGAENKQALRALVDAGTPTGILGYEGDRAVAWCSLGPRGDFARLARSPKTRGREEREPVWSIVCFYVERGARRGGAMHRLLADAVEYARALGARTLEAWPTDPKPGWKPLFADGYLGIASAFRRAGFLEVERREGKNADGLTVRLALGPAPRRPRRRS